MSSTWGNHLKLSVFGESHSDAIGVCIDGLPAGAPIDLSELHRFMQRRAPGKNKLSTPRREADAAHILSGFYDGATTGTPLACMIENTNTRSGDYSAMASVARPGHADYTGFLRYHGHGDVRGGGHFSGRLTAPLVFAGGICKQLLRRAGIAVGVHVASIAGVDDSPFDPVTVDGALLDRLAAMALPVLDDGAGASMRDAVEDARLSLDSVGGVVECAVVGLPGGIGSPMFDGIENRIASLVFGIPAVKGLEFGIGFAASRLRGSENNDEFHIQKGPDGESRIRTATNRHGGILGGISSGMPIVFRVALKPTPSIAKEQNTVDFQSGVDTTLAVTGRHDPCIVPRAAVCVEAAAALAVLDLLLDEQGSGFLGL